MSESGARPKAHTNGTRVTASLYCYTCALFKCEENSGSARKTPWHVYNVTIVVKYY